MTDLGIKDNPVHEEVGGSVFLCVFIQDLFMLFESLDYGANL